MNHELQTARPDTKLHVVIRRKIAIRTQNDKQRFEVIAAVNMKITSSGMRRRVLS